MSYGALGRRRFPDGPDDTADNITSKSDVGTYSYPATGQPRPHAVSATSGLISATFTYDAKGNLTGGNGLTIAYTTYGKTSSITRGSNTVTFAHDTEHQRYQQIGPGGTTLYLAGSGVMAEKVSGSGGSVTWNNYLVAAGGVIGMYVERSDETTATRYFHKDHLGSIAIITDEAGAVVERLSYDAWGKRRFPDGTDDPAGSVTSQTTRGFTGHEQLADVGLIHMNGRVEACPRVGEAEPGGPPDRPLRQRRSHDREPLQHPGLEPLLLRRQQPAQLHRPIRLLLHGLLLEADVQGRRQLPTMWFQEFSSNWSRG